MRLIWLLVVSLSVGVIQDVLAPAPAFDKTKYPPEFFTITEESRVIGQLQIRIVQVKPKDTRRDRLDVTGPYYCSAWIDIDRSKTLVRRFAFEDIQPVGDDFGVFIPKTQPSANALMLVKRGDYDGRLIVVARDGHIVDVPGGNYFVTADKRYLVSEYASDDSAISLIDLEGLREVARFDDLPHNRKWMVGEQGYFAAPVPAGASEPVSEPAEMRPDEILRLDLVAHTLTRERITAEALAKAKQIKFDVDAWNLGPDCTSKPK